MRQTASQQVIFNIAKVQVENFTVDSGASTTLLTSTAHGLENGDALTLTVTSEVGDALPTGLSTTTRYYVINATANTFELSLTIGGSAVEFSDDGQGTFTYWLKGKTIYVADYEHIVLVMHTDLAELTFKIQGACTVEEPNFAISKAKDNIWDYVSIKDLEDGSSIDGDTGVSVTSGSDDVRQFEINTNGLNYITAEITAFTEGILGLFATCYESK